MSCSFCSSIPHPSFDIGIASVLIGYFTVVPLLFGGALSDAIFIREAHDVVAQLAYKFEDGPFAFGLAGFMTPVFWLAMLGVAIATYIYLFNPKLADTVKQRLYPLWKVLDNKYGFDDLYMKGITGGSLRLASGLSSRGDRMIIDGWIVNGSARLVGHMSAVMRTLQSGFLFHYAFAMIIGLVAIVAAFVLLR